MSSESPLDFFSSARKSKGKKDNNLPSKGSTPTKSSSSADKKAPPASKTKPKVDTSEAFKILARIQEMHQDLNNQMDAICKKTGKSLEEMEKILESKLQLSAKDKETLKAIKQDMANKITGKSEAGGPARATVVQKKKKKPTGDLRTKSIGSKRKWMPMS